jgi:hypothetical protein
MALIQKIADRVALGPDDGQDFRLITVMGTQHAGGNTARRRVEADPEAGEILGVEYAGRADSGDPVFLVTYKLKDTS